jgi:sec-independent protein translocase protein TatA
MFSNIGGTELMVLLAVGLMFFGNKRMKELAKGLGESTKEAKKIKKEFDKAASDENNEAVEERGDN